MNNHESKQCKWDWVQFGVLFLLLLGEGIYFSRKGALYSSFILSPSLLGVGLLFTALFFILRLSKLAERRGFFFFLFLLWQFVQGVVGGLLFYYPFHLSWQDSLCFPIGVFLAYFIVAFIQLAPSVSLASLSSAFLSIAGGAVALRLGGIWGGALYGLGLSASTIVGAQFLVDEKKKVWLRVVFFTGALLVGRGLLQYYLMETGYDSLGVVITHPYTFVALFLGFMIPVIHSVFEREPVFHPFFQILILAILLPLFLGMMIHVRPLAGYLMGMIVSSYIIGLFFASRLWTGWVSLIGCGVSVVGISYFQKYSYLDRASRIDILTVALVVFALLTALGGFLGRKKEI